MAGHAEGDGPAGSQGPARVSDRLGPAAPEALRARGPADPAAIGEPARSRTRGACTPTATVAGSGPCGSTPASGALPESNRRYRYLLERGTTGLSVAFDLPTQIGYDSDDPHAAGEVGRVGVAIDSLEDMETLLDGIPLEKVSTSMTINATAAILLALYVAVARRRGIPEASLSGTVQNDILKEYVARGTYIYPPAPSLRLATDVFAYGAGCVPRWNTISVSGYHIREAGTTARPGAWPSPSPTPWSTCAPPAPRAWTPTHFGERISFFFACHSDFIEEVAKFRAARRLWARWSGSDWG